MSKLYLFGIPDITDRAGWEKTNFQIYSCLK